MRRTGRRAASPCTCRTTWRRRPIPPAAVTLLECVARATGLALPDEALRDAARRTDEEIARQVETSDEISELVQALERQYDAFVDAASGEGLLAEPGRGDAHGGRTRRPVRALPGRAAGPLRHP